MKNDFKSFLAVEFSNYLQLLLSAGRSTHNHEIMLRSLDSFLLQNHTFEKCLSESIINQSYRLIDELFQMLQDVETDDEDGAKELWFCFAL